MGRLKTGNLHIFRNLSYSIAVKAVRLSRLNAAGLVSHAVLRGNPTASQLYLDKVLDEVLEEVRNTGRDVRNREELNLAQVIYYSMRKRPSSIHMINGTTNEELTNEQILKRAIPFARALIANGAKGRAILLVMKNTEHLMGIYYGALYAGVTLFLLDPNSTSYETQHFLALVQPYYVFCDNDRYEDVNKATQAASLPPNGVVSTRGLAKFSAGISDDIDSFRVTDASPEATPIMLPTSGSTGLAKAALMTHRGLITQLPSLWSYHEQFPRPTERAMFLSTAQWMTHTNMLTTCPVYDITMLVTSTRSPEHVIGLFENHRPTWVLLIPGFATTLAGLVLPHQITSLRTVILTGGPPNPNTLAILKVKLPKSTRLCNSYGMTEAQGFTAIPDYNTRLGSPGKIFNVLDFKLVNDDGQVVRGIHQNGELYLRSICILKGYLNNVAAYQECMTDDGWWKTGDIFYKDGNEDLWFVERKKLWFKYLNVQISPEELENIINEMPGVQESVVCGTEDGAATAIIIKPGSDVSRTEVHQVVDDKVSEYKRLRAGIAFVETLPLTHSGKLHRRDCTEMVHELIKNGQCF